MTGWRATSTGPTDNERAVSAAFSAAGSRQRSRSTKLRILPRDKGAREKPRTVVAITRDGRAI